MGLYDQIAQLPLSIESYSLEGLEQDVSSNFTRCTTVIHLQGGGEEGVGEDTTYTALDQIALQDAGASLTLVGEHTVDSFSKLLDELNLFPVEPELKPSYHYRRWGFESAALDLALRQAGKAFTEIVGRRTRPVRFVVSSRLGDPPSFEYLEKWLDLYPDLHFKLDPTSEWSAELVDQLAATGAVDAVDLKAHYEGTPVDQETDLGLYQLVVDKFPDAWIEDPEWSEKTEPILGPHRERITWDAPLHSLADIESLPFPPKAVNVKPSRFATLSELSKVYQYCEEHGIEMYGGGQFELGPGRGQIQYLASVFHPDTGNDVAPQGYNEPEPPKGLPASPLSPTPSPTGFRFGG